MDKLKEHTTVMEKLTLMDLTNAANAKADREHMRMKLWCDVLLIAMKENRDYPTNPATVALCQFDKMFGEVEDG